MKYFLLILLLILPLVSGYSEPVGIIDINSTLLLAWNQGTIANETYLNKSSGLLQHANTLDRQDDITYFLGIGRNVSGTIQYIGIDSLPSVIKKGSDNNTFWWASGEFNVTSGGTYRFKKNLSQNTYDDYVKIDFKFSNTNAILGNSFFVTGIKNMDIDNDKISEKITMFDGNDDTIIIFWDNRTGTMWWSNITRIIIDGGVGAYSYDLKFPNGVIVYYNHTSSSTNGQFIFLDKIGTIAANVEYNFSYYWIDAQCVIGCTQLACETYAYSNNTNDYNNYTQGTQFAQVGCAWNVRTIADSLDPCTGDCIVSDACSMYWTNAPHQGISSVITNKNTNSPLSCQNSLCSVIGVTSKNTLYFRNLIASAIGIRDFKCGLNQRIMDLSLSTYYADDIYDIQKQEPLTTIWSPTNNTVINSTVNWLVFGVNNTGNMTANNITLYFNNTANHTVSPNLTINRTFDFYGCYDFTARACYSHYCPYSSSGNYTFCQIRLQYTLLWNPLNFTPFNYSSIIIFNANWTNNIPDNMTIYFNNTVNKSQSGTTNFSQSIMFDTPGVWRWDVLNCIANRCVWSTNGNWTILVKDKTPFNITLWREDNNSDITNRSEKHYNSWFRISANTTGDCVDNITYYLNASNVYIGVVGINYGCANISYNHTVTDYGIWSWTTRACYNGYCKFADNGNWTFYRNASTQIVLVSPTNNTVSTTSWNVINCSWNYLLPNNITLYINNTPNITTSNNLSTNITLSNGIYNWDCLGCDNNECFWSTNGNRTITINSSVTSTVDNSFFVLKEILQNNPNYIMTISYLILSIVFCVLAYVHFLLSSVNLH
jgi:hypothetical protein